MSAIEDYLQLIAKGSPLNNQWQQLRRNITQNVPSQQDLKNPVKMQEWSMGAAFNSPMLASIRKPSDIVKTINSGIAPNLAVDTVAKRYNKYLSKDWATDNDPFVKMLNEGQDITGPITKVDNKKYTNNYSAIPNNFLNDHYLFNQIRPDKINSNQARIGIPEGDRLKLASDYTTGRPLGVILDMLKNNQGTELFNNHVSSLNDVMNQMRKVRGTNAVGQTRAAKYFEDINDLNAVSSIVNPKNSRVKDIVNSNYYKTSVDKPAIFTPKINDYRMDQFSHMADVIPQTNRMSLIDSINYAINADDAAILAKEAARLEAGKSAAFNKKELTHQFDDGTSWNKISDSDALKAEGEHQGHCVGSYCDKVNSGESEIYSLRDTNNTPILTAEYDPYLGIMKQVKGRFNSNPNKDFNSHIKTLKNMLNDNFLFKK